MINNDIVGQKFGMLTVIKKTERKASNGDYYYLCQCGCGNIKEIIRSNLVSKSKYKTISCGCYKQSGNHVLDRIDKDREYHMVKNLYCRLKKRHIKFGGTLADIISIDYFWKLIKKECYYCGTKNSDSAQDTLNTNYIFYHNGIDRLDSSKGYVKDNVVCCCKHCNIAKSDRSIKEYEEWYEKVYNYFIKK